MKTITMGRSRLCCVLLLNGVAITGQHRKELIAAKAPAPRDVKTGDEYCDESVNLPKWFGVLSKGPGRIVVCE